MPLRSRALSSCVHRGQMMLLGHEAPSFDEGFRAVEHRDLGRGAWIDHVPGWVTGHATVFDVIVSSTRFRTIQEHLYDRVLDAPRLVAAVPEDGPGHPILEPIRRALSARYGESFEHVTLALYRDGKDSVAWHGDRVARKMETALVATVSLGTARPFLLRPYGGGTSLRFRLGLGDLLVMGGNCQRTFQHSVPKIAHASPRLAVMFRPQWQEPTESR